MMLETTHEKIQVIINKTQYSKIFIWPLFTFSQIAYNKQLHKFLIYMVKQTSIKQYYHQMLNMETPHPSSPLITPHWKSFHVYS